MARLVGIDVARGIAVLGMITAHVGPYAPVPGSVLDRVLDSADGRPSALFVVLAGLSLALLSGGPSPVVERDLTRARVRVAARAVVVLVVGLLLERLDTPILVILPTYAVLFLAGCLVLTWPVRTLVATAAGVALVAPLVRGAFELNTDPGAGLLGDLAVLLVGPHYPALVWFAYLLAGLALGRCDLTSAGVQRRAALLGAALVVAGYGGGWLARTLVLDHPLTSTAPHSSSTFEVVGNTGVALLVICASLAAAARVPRVLSPVAAVGALAFTAYTAQVVAVAVIGPAVVWEPRWESWVAFVVGTVLVCWAWRAWLGRGPLERLLHGVSTRVAERLVPRETPLV
ncbi:heparan-alpha-glucosaminide N-acetyltransferase domain-containing protein [Cellulomonas palmilytica]|uniref:heparan-alpha-glucosaminide N-acetyltransferase domain-containing protein n=1 Tax=Cellulomonas palmilytica TaxID=2608402 RepID=UPI001F3561CA|nr:heparan-alpha-glucosaminide N-acetyltransferase domain-containing protein [Cellulomonas palmilytica]